MATNTSLLQQIDSQLDQLLAGWTIYTTIIALLAVTILVYPLFLSKEPDTHPLLLARQSSASHVRQPGESAVFRSLETPHGYPLRTGLNVKDPGAAKWANGRDGDLRDVWKQAIKAPCGADGKPTGEPGKVLTVLGKEEVIEHSFAKLTKEINIVGEYMKEHTGSRVAIYLPNSVELLVAFFATIFYGFTPILIPRGQPIDILAKILNETEADVLVAAAGVVPLNDLVKYSPGLKEVIWVVEQSSRHMGWNEIPEGVGGQVDVAVWHDIVDEKQDSASPDPPSDIPRAGMTNVVTLWQPQDSDFDDYEIIEFSQKNIVAAVAAQLSALPRTHRLGPSDVLLSLDQLSLTYPLVITLAGLFSNASIALTSVAGYKADYSSAFPGISPTVVIASLYTLSQACTNQKAATKGTLQKIKYSMQSRTLASGIMPKTGETGNSQSLRLIYTANRIEDEPLTSAELFDLKLLTGARTVHALTGVRVAGPVAQTSIFDYRKDTKPGRRATFGPPLSCVEVKLKEESQPKKTEDGNPVGWLVVSGPAVVGGEAMADRFLTVRDDNTLAFASDHFL